MTGTVTVLDDAAAAHAALSPLRLQLLQALDEPASASELGSRLALSRQKVGYHLRVLEEHGLIELAEERQRRGFVERRFRRCGTPVLSPDLVEPDASLSPADAMSAQAVVAAAADAVRAIGSLTRAAAADGRQLVTATMATDVTFGRPADLRSFLEDVAALAARYDGGEDGAGARYRISVLTHPNTDNERDGR